MKKKVLGCLFFAVCLAVQFGTACFAEQSYALDNVSWPERHAYYWSLEPDEADEKLNALAGVHYPGKLGASICSATALDGTKSYRYETAVQIGTKVSDQNVVEKGWGFARVYVGLNQKLNLYGYNDCIDAEKQLSQILPDCVGVELKNHFNNGKTSISLYRFEDGEAVLCHSVEMTEAQQSDDHIFSLLFEYDAVKKSMKVSVDGTLLAQLPDVDSQLAGGYLAFEGQWAIPRITKTAYEYTVVENTETGDSLVNSLLNLSVAGVIMLSVFFVFSFRRDPLDRKERKESGHGE